MSTEYPDVLGDIVEARRRYDVNGVHYLLTLQPDTIAPGEPSALRAWLQSCWDVPVVATLTIELPDQPKPTMSLIQKRTEVPLEAGEVGEVTIPIATSPDTAAGEHALVVALGVKQDMRGLYVRGQKKQGLLGDSLLTFSTGMDLARILGLGYVAQTCAEQQLSLTVQGAPQPGQQPDLTPTYVSHWTLADLPVQGKARHYVNDQRLYLLPKVIREELYRVFLEESQERLRDAGIKPHIGEAIFAAKVLTFAVEYFLKRPNWQDAILVPAYVLAYRYELEVDDPVFLIARADYARIARLAISLSFGLLRQLLKRDLWTLEEQVAVADLVADRVERGGTLSPEFLYLPLLLGGLIVAQQVEMPGEDLRQSLDLVEKARQQRSSELAANPELVNVFERLLQIAESRF
ncbi:MAG: hypothetical protein M8467_09620 [Anaerolineae bacterium]|nr:hypothetical protein [Anaerolineae bacterium]